jgi:hypothetical protein
MKTNRTQKVYVVTHAIDRELDLLGVGADIKSAKLIASKHTSHKLTWKSIDLDAWRANDGFHSYVINEQELVAAHQN